CLDDPGGAGGSDDIEAKVNQFAGHVGNEGLVIFAHADEHGAGGRQHFAGTQLGLGEGLGEAVPHTHHLTGGLHFRPEDRVNAGELGEGEHRFLDAVKVRYDFLGEAQLLQRLAGHDPCGDLRQRCADALGYEGHGTRSTGVHLDDVDNAVLQCQLHVHQADHTQLQRHALDLIAHLILNLGGQRVRRQRTSRVTGVHASLLDMLHDRADDHIGTVGYGIHVDFDGAVEVMIQQHRAVVGDLHRITQVALELVFLIDDLHGTAAQHIGGTHHQRVTDPVGGDDRLVFAAHGGVGRLTQFQALDRLLDTLAVLGTVDRLGAGTDDRHAGFFQSTGQFQRGLPAVLDDHALGLLDADDLQYVFQGDRLEVQAIGGVIVGGDGFRVAVDHDGLVTVFAHGQRGVHAAVVELDALTDAVRPAPQHHDLVATGWAGLAFFLVGGVHVGGIGGE